MSLPAIEHLTDSVEAIDDIVYKALRLSEVARIARYEVALRRYLLARWRARTRKAKQIAGKMAEQLKPASEIAKAVRKEMLKWSKEVLPRHKKTQAEIYRLARIAGWKKASRQTRASLGYSTLSMTEELAKAKPPKGIDILPTFDLVDEEALETLASHQTFWLDDHYDENLGEMIADTTRETMIEAGMDRKAAGRLMRERVEGKLGRVLTPAGFHGTAAQYFEMVAANAATTARAMGQVRSFQSLMIKKVEVTNPADERTCEVCSHMNGKVFTIEQVSQVMESELAAETPEGVKRAHPFLGEGKKDLDKLSSWSKTPGRAPDVEAQRLADAGFANPPYHGRCFARNVVVWTARGLLQIHRVEIGDLVLTHRLRWRRVTHKMASWHSGRMQSVRDVTSTLDHPFYVFRAGEILFDGIKKGDRIGSPKTESIDELSQLRPGFLRDSVQNQNTAFVLGEMYARKQSTSRPHSAREKQKVRSKKISKRPVCQRGASRSQMPAVREIGVGPSIDSEEIQVLFNGVQSPVIDQGRMDRLPGMRQEILDDPFPPPQDVFVHMPRGSKAEAQNPWECWCTEGPLCWREESDVRQIAGSRQVGNAPYPVAGGNPSSKLVGRESCAGVAEARRTIPLRAKEIRASERTDLQTGFLPHSTGCLDRGKGLDESTRLRDRATLSAQTSMGTAGRDERLEFVSVEVNQIERWRGYVWNLTVEGDESFLVGESGMIVHNCRCTLDVSVEAGSWEEF